MQLNEFEEKHKDVLDKMSSLIKHKQQKEKQMYDYFAIGQLFFGVGFIGSAFFAVSFFAALRTDFGFGISLCSLLVSVMGFWGFRKLRSEINSIADKIYENFKSLKDILNEEFLRDLYACKHIKENEEFKNEFKNLLQESRKEIPDLQRVVKYYESIKRIIKKQSLDIDLENKMKEYEVMSNQSMVNFKI